jgi:hypothetical protein
MELTYSSCCSFSIREKEEGRGAPSSSFLGVCVCVFLGGNGFNKEGGRRRRKERSEEEVRKKKEKKVKLGGVAMEKAKL